MTRIWNKIPILKNTYKTIEWNKWQNIDRKDEVIKTILPLSPSWVAEQRVIANSKENHELNNKIALEEATRAIDNIKKYLAPSPDNVEYKIIEKLSEEYYEVTRLMFNYMLMNTYMPEELKYQITTDPETFNPILFNRKNGWIIEKAHYMDLKTAMGYRNNTPTNILDEAKVLTIINHAEYFARNFIMKTLVSGNEQIKESLNTLLILEEKIRFINSNTSIELITEECEQCNMKQPVKKKKKINKKPNIWKPAEKVLTDIKTGRSFQRGQSEEKLYEKFKAKHKLDNEVIIIFSDGSKTDGNPSTGAAVYIENTKEIIKINSLGTIDALETDTITANHNAYVTSIKKSYLELANADHRHKKTIVIGWVPAHKGIKGNVRADQEAKKASKKEKEEKYKIPYTDLRCIFMKEMAERIDKQEITEESRYKGKFYYEIFNRENQLDPWFQNINTHKEYLKLVNRLKSNHNFENSLARVGYVATSRCECGDKVGDINHLVFVCTIYDEKK
ncbi:hypothetical protein PV327_010235 [Microctonus hyperodae]|uniref:RNase H type-1 domain-containing protein n=1 Tax=Microctonus hyperodae TaxID=165561 RepID=A0AA39FSB8_MICHY|nr:hypothetical protein PV327_010235 [Microctonus hyperodae]